MVDTSTPNDFFPDKDHMFFREMEVRHRQFAELRESLLYDLLESGVKQATIIAYHSDLGALLWWCIDNDFDVLALTVDDLDCYLDELRANNYSLNTIARRITTFRRFYDHAVEAGAIAVSPARGLYQRRPQPQLATRVQRLPRLTTRQRQRMLAATENPCERAVLGLLFDRVSVTQIERASVLDVVGDPPTLRTSFRRVPESVPISTETRAALLEHRGERAAGALILGDTDKPIDRFRIGRMLAELGRRAGIRTPVDLSRLPQPRSRSPRTPSASSQKSSTD